MSEDRVYKDGDIVWVKLGNNWWPGEVTGVHRQPDGLIKQLKKKPYCVVKFFQEDAYEYVKSAKQIFPFQCNRKDEFVRKGNALYNAKNKFMEKFPSDVDFAERTSRKAIEDGTLIINDRPDSIVKAILGQSLTRFAGDYYDNDCSSSGAACNKRRSGDSVTKILNITPQRTSSITSPTTAGGNKSSTPALATRFNAGGSADPNFYQCNLCDFSSQRQNVMIMHRRTHSNIGNNNTSLSAITARSAYIYNHAVTSTPKATSTAAAFSGTLNSYGTKMNNTSAPSTLLTPNSPQTSQTSTQNYSNNRSATALKKGYLSRRARTSRSLVDHNLCARIDADVADITLPDAVQSLSICSSPTKRLTLESDEDVIVTEIDVTDHSLYRTNNAATYTYTPKDDGAQLSHNRIANTSSIKNTTLPTSAAEIQKRLLADWSDEERYDSDENEVTKTQGATKRNEAEQQQSRLQPARNLFEGKVDDASAIGTMHTTALPTTSNRIRNIPKKDRRDIVLKQFISDFAIGNTSSSPSMTPPIVSLDSTNSNSSSDSVVIVQAETIVIDEDPNEQQEQQEKPEQHSPALNNRKQDTRAETNIVQFVESTPSPSVSPKTTPAVAAPAATNLLSENEIIEHTISDDNLQKSVEAVENRKFVYDDDSRNMQQTIPTIEIIHEDENMSKSVEEIVEIVDDENISKTGETVEIVEDVTQAGDNVHETTEIIEPIEILHDSDNINKTVAAEATEQRVQVSEENIDSTQKLKLPANAATTPPSCFDFREEDEDDNNTENDVLMSIANYKKKYLSPNKSQTKESILNYETDDTNARRNSKETPQAQEALEQKDQKLSDEIEKLLEQTTPAVVDVNAMITAPTRSSIDGKILTSTEVPVKGLPIKERGKRIFKSRIQSRAVEERLEVAISTNVLEAQNIALNEEKIPEKIEKLHDAVEQLAAITDSANNDVSCALTKPNSATDNTDEGTPPDKEIEKGDNLDVKASETQRAKEVEETVDKVPVNDTPREVIEEEVITTNKSIPIDTLITEEVETQAATEITPKLITTEEKSAGALLNEQFQVTTPEKSEECAVITPAKSVEDLSIAAQQTVENVEVMKVVVDVVLEATQNEVAASEQLQPSHTVDNDNETDVSVVTEALPVVEFDRRSVTPSEAIEKPNAFTNDLNNSLMSEILTTKAMHADIIANSNEDSLHEIKEHSDDAQISNEIPSRYTSPTDENSSVGISDAGAEFGSPTSMLDDERLPLMSSSDLVTPTDGLIEEQCSTESIQTAAMPMDNTFESIAKHDVDINDRVADTVVCKDDNVEDAYAESTETENLESTHITKEPIPDNTSEKAESVVKEESEIIAQEEIREREQKVECIEEAVAKEVEATAGECVPMAVSGADVSMHDKETEVIENDNEQQRTNKEINDKNVIKQVQIEEEIHLKNDNEKEVEDSEEAVVATADKQTQEIIENNNKDMQCNAKANIEFDNKKKLTNENVIIASESEQMQQTNEQIITAADSKNIHELEAATKSTDIVHTDDKISASILATNTTQQSHECATINAAITDAPLQLQTESETLLAESDDDGIESPPHEPLSGNELEVSDQSVQKTKTTKPKRVTKGKETPTVAVETLVTESKSATAETDEEMVNKTQPHRKTTLEEMTEIQMELEKRTFGRRITRAASQQNKSHGLHGYINELELSKLYYTKETPKTKDSSTRRNIRKSKSSPSIEIDETQSCAAVEEVQSTEQNKNTHEIKKSIKVGEQESETTIAVAKKPDVHDYATITAEKAQKVTPNITCSVERDPLEISTGMHLSEGAVLTEKITRKRRSCIKITPRRSPNSRLLSEDVKSKVSEQQTDETVKIKSNIEQTTNVNEHVPPQKEKLLEEVNADGDNGKAKKAKVEKNESSECGESGKINTTEAVNEVAPTAAAAVILTAANAVEPAISEHLQKEETTNSLLKSAEVEEEQVKPPVTDTVANVDAGAVKIAPNNELTQSTTMQDSQLQKTDTTTELTPAAVTGATTTATVSEIRSFRPRRKTIALEVDVEQQKQQATSNTNGSDVKRVTLTKTKTRTKTTCMRRTPSPTNSSPMEKVRINVDVAHPLSSQIANILATAGSGSHQQHAASISLKLTKSATLKRKKSIEDVIPSFIIERPTMGGGHAPHTHLEIVEKDAVTHVQTMCPQVQITRKEKLVEMSELKQQQPQAKVQLQKSKYTKKGAEVATSTAVAADATANVMFDINNMPMILSNDHILQENVHFVISPATAANAVVVSPPAVGLVETVVASESNDCSTPLSDAPKILQQQIIQPARQTPPPPPPPPPLLHMQRQRSTNQPHQQSQSQLQTNNAHTQLGVDSRGNKYVIIKTPPADLVLQQPVASLQHLQQTQTQLQAMAPAPPQSAPKATAAGVGFNIGSNVSLRPITEPKVHTATQQQQLTSQPQVQSQIKIKSAAAAATGGRKQAGNIIALPTSVSMKPQLQQQLSHVGGEAPQGTDVVKNEAQQQLNTAGGNAAGAVKIPRRQSINARKAQGSTQLQPQLQPQLQYQFKPMQPQPMPVQQRRLTAAPIERQDSLNRGFNRRLSCTDTSVLPAKIPRTIMSSAAFRGDEVALAAEQQLLQLQEQRRKVQSAPTTPISSVPPPLHPLHSRKSRHIVQQHRDRSGNGKKRISAELDTMQQQQQQRMAELEKQQQQININALQQNVVQPPPLAHVTGPLLTTQLTQIAAPPLVQIIAPPPLSEVAASTLNTSAIVTPLAQIAATPLVQVTGALLAQAAVPPLIQMTAPPLVQVTTALPHQQEQVVDSPNISEEQLSQLEQFSLEDMKNVVAVRAGPIPGYPDIFVLYKLVENSVTMFQQGPYYLNHDHNQLVQVPPEALEGIELIVDHPSTEDIVNLLHQAQGTQLEALEPIENNSPTPFICLGSPDNEDATAGTIITEADMEGEMDSPEIVSDDLNGDAQIPVDSDSENSAGNYILLTIGDQQVGCKVDELAQLLANSDDPHIITINGTPFVLSDEIINALRIHTDEQQRQPHLHVAETADVQQLADESGAADIIAVALAGTELYGNEVLEIETSQALQLMGADGNIVFQPQVLPPAHLTPPITAHTSETNALLNQTPIMSTLEKPSTGVTACHGSTLDDSLAVIGLSAQSSSVPTSLELPITVTNPAIAPKVTMATAHADMIQFQPPRSVTAALASDTRIYNEPGS